MVAVSKSQYFILLLKDLQPSYLSFFWKSCVRVSYFLLWPFNFIRPVSCRCYNRSRIQTSFHTDFVRLDTLLFIYSWFSFAVEPSNIFYRKCCILSIVCILLEVKSALFYALWTDVLLQWSLWQMIKPRIKWMLCSWTECASGNPIDLI